MSKQTITNTDILFYAFRYALGRKTGAVNQVASEIIKHWDIIPDIDKGMYKAEIRDAISRDSAGDLCDIQEWQKILNLNL